MYSAESVIEIIKQYGGSGGMIPVFFLCLLFCYREAEEKYKKRILLTSLLSVIFVFNELSLKIIGKLTDAATYYRFIWAIPVIIVISYVFAKLAEGTKDRWQRAAVILLAAAVFYFGQSPFLTEGSVPTPVIPFNISEDAQQVCQIIESDKKVERPVIAADLELHMIIRIYDASLVWGISRTAYQKYNDMEDYRQAGKFKEQKILIQAVNHGDQSAGEDLKKALKSRNIDYLILPTAAGMDQYLESMDCEVVDRSISRTVYLNKNSKNGTIN